MNTVYLPLVRLPKGLERTPCRQSSCDSLYLSYDALWTKGYVIFVPPRGFVLAFVIVPESAGVSLLHELLQLPFLYKFFYLLLQIPAVFCVMPVVFVEIVVFSSVTHIR